MDQILLKEGKLLNEDGSLSETGYAFKRIKDLNKDAIKPFKKIKYKEWDYYGFLNNDIGLLITVSNLTYSTLFSVTYIDFKANKYLTKSITKLFPNKKYRLSSKSKNFSWQFGQNLISFSYFKDKLTIYIRMTNFADGKTLFANLNVTSNCDKTIVTTIPFKKKGDFYYNQKANLLRADGNIILANKNIAINEAYGVLDWGRGVWPYRSTWYWSSLSVKTEDGNLLGFNLGYGLGDSSKGTENVLFYNDEIYKLDDVKFIFSTNKNRKNEYDKDIELISNDGNINLLFTPLFNRKDHINFLLIESDQNQVFGKFSGTIKVNGKTFEFKKYIGFLEKVINRY